MILGWGWINFVTLMNCFVVSCLILFSLNLMKLFLIWFLFSMLSSPFWEHVKEILNPANSIGAPPLVYYTIFAFFVFVFNIFDIVSALCLTLFYVFVELDDKARLLCGIDFVSLILIKFSYIRECRWDVYVFVDMIEMLACL